MSNHEAESERARIVIYLLETARIHDANEEYEGYKTQAKYHAEACRMMAAAIEAGEHLHGCTT